MHSITLKTLLFTPVCSGLLLFLLSALPAYAQSGAARVSVAAVETEEIVEQLTLTGTVTAARRSPISSEIAGKIAQLQVEEGDRIPSGGVLATLDARRARLASRQAQAAMRQAEAELVDAERRLEMARRLAERRAVSEDERGTLETEVQTDRAVLERLRAEAGEQALLIDMHEIRAPFAGVVAQRFTEAGAWVEPGDPVVELVDLDQLRIDVAAPQEFYPRLAGGARATVRLDAQPGSALEGTLLSAVPVASPGSRTFLARIVVSNENAALMPGLSAKVTLHLPTGNRHPVIPRDALIRHPDGRTTAWVVVSAGGALTAQERNIVTGRAFAGRVEVRRGLSDGDSVVTEGNEGLQPGQAVEIVRNAS
ncbi:efflux transporter, RND family, MFP subunit [Hyphomonas neptunium ATCC 15444]|uniref:Efflux transporter, RND family, MFP subunit n=2 Tax=Hyphomonas TaxID=85 RepID=Q0C056_HYPNA|nr:efflux transporter, RND family, MFP subunit [Hyphomonas neptunium ATCC 15444]KCZ90530.1 RND family efflux transporter MFP subunit [Hyphomonas hirschiana VP5]